MGNGWIFVIAGGVIVVGYAGYLIIQRLKQENRSKDVPTFNPLENKDNSKKGKTGDYGKLEGCRE